MLIEAKIQYSSILQQSKNGYCLNLIWLFLLSHKINQSYKWKLCESI